MTLKESIMQMSNEELAKMLIQLKSEIEYNYDMDYKSYDCEEIDYYVTTNNNQFSSYDDAIQYQIELLNMDCE